MIDRDQMAESYRTTDQARAALGLAIAATDAEEITRAAINRERDAFLRDLRRLDEELNDIAARRNRGAA